MTSSPEVGKKRVVSLISSATEIVFELDCQSMLVGRSHECDYPEAVKNLPTCSKPLFETNGTSLEIDQRVRELAEKALSIYKVDSEKLNLLQPNVILTQTQCEVCAVSLKEVQAAMAGWMGLQNNQGARDPEIVPLHPNLLNDLWSDMRRVGKALGIENHAEEKIRKRQAQLKEIEQNAFTQVIPAWQGQRPVVAAVEWMDPVMLSGNWIPELVWKAGGVPVLPDGTIYDPAQKPIAQLLEKSRTLSLQALHQVNPDVICIFPCGFDLQRTQDEFKVLAKKEEWQQLNAFQKGQVFLADGNAFFNRPGPRLVDSTQILQEMLIEAATANDSRSRSAHLKNNFFRFSADLAF